MPRAVTKTLRWTLGFVGVCLLIIALLLGALRVLLPLTPAFQEEIAEWTSESFGYPVEFARIEPSWGLTGPEFRLRGVRVMSKRGGGPLLLADEIMVGLNLWRLLPGRGFTFDRMSIAGASLSLERRGPGTFSIQGRDPAYYAGGPARMLAFVPADIQVRDIWVEYVESDRGVRENLWLERLAVKITKGRIVLDGRIVLPEEYGEWLGLGADIDLGQWNRALAPSGAWRLRLEGRGVHLGKMRELVVEASALPMLGRGDFSVFMDLMDADVDNFFGELDIAGLQILEGAADHVFDNVAGQFEWHREGREYTLSAARVRIARAGKVWADTELSARWSVGDQGQLTGLRLESGFARLEDVVSPLRGLASRAGIATPLLPVAGDVSNLILNWPRVGVELPEVEMDFSGLDLDWTGRGLKVGGLSGRLRHQGESGSASIAISDGGSLQAPWLEESASIGELQAELSWSKAMDAWLLEGNNLRLGADGLDWAGRFSLSLPSGDDSPVLDLSGSGENIEDIPAVLRTLPWKNTPGLPFGWLGKALHAGRGTGWNLLLSGPLRTFPFGGSVLRLEMDFRDAVLTLNEDWPDARDLSGRMVLNGPALVILDGEANLAGVRWRDLSVEVADLTRAVVEVSAVSADPVPRLVQGLSRIPVSDRIYPALLQAETSGAAATRFDFRLPIANRGAWWMNAETVLNDAGIRLNEFTPPVARLRGTMTVSRDGLLAEDLRGQFVGEPVAIRVAKAPQEAEGYGYRLELNGAASANTLRSLFDCCALDRLSGDFAWSAEVLVPSTDSEVVRPVTARLQTDLLGFSSAFPHPLGKAADELGPTELVLQWGTQLPPRLAGRLGLGLGPGVVTEFMDQGEGWRLHKGRLHFGERQPQLPAVAGLVVDGELDWLRPGAWASVFGGETESIGLPWEIDLGVGAVYAMSSELRDQRLWVRPRIDGWQVELKGEFADGRIFWPRSGAESAQLLADINRLRLVHPDPQPPQPADPRLLPAGTLLVDDLEIGKLRLGEVRARYQKTAGGLGVNWFQTQSRTFSSEGSAAWLVADEAGKQHLGRLDIEMRSSDVAASLEQLGYARGISGDRGTLALSASWEGPPAGDFLTRANGTVSLEVEAGDVPALDPGGGRMLGVLSLARLPRRLALDFREITEEGLPFDRLAGDFSLRDGQAYTCNMGLQGAVAGLALFGRTGLQDRSYDQVAVVSPNLPDLLSLGGVIIGGTGLGATMLLLSQAFREPLQAVSANYYRVSGSWDDPDVNRVLREDIDLEAFGDCARYLEEQLVGMPDIDWDALLTQTEEELPAEVGEPEADAPLPALDPAAGQEPPAPAADSDSQTAANTR